MPEREGLGLYRAVGDLRRPGPVLEIGGYCGLSALYLGAAARQAGRLVYSLDHHRGSQENQAGWKHHDPGLVDRRTGKMDTLPFFRQTIEEAGLEQTVVAIVGHSVLVAAAWSTPLSMLFIDGGHAEDVAMADYLAWVGHLVPGGVLAIHDVFETPADGGQAPFHVWRRARGEGFETAGVAGSLRLLLKPAPG